jgi:hypothetical protein
VELFLDSLFRVSKVTELPGTEVTVRALSDAELRSRESIARAASAKYRKLLKDPNSDEHLAFIESLDELTDPQLVEIIVSQYSQLEAQDEARSQSKPEFIPTPEDPSDSEKLDAVDEQQSEDERASELYRTALKTMTDNYRKNVESWDRPKLLTEAKNWNVRGLAYTEYLRTSILASLYLSTEKNGKRYFANLEALENTNQMVVNRLYEEFVKVNEVDAWEVAKQALQGNSTP